MVPSRGMDEVVLSSYAKEGRMAEEISANIAEIYGASVSSVKPGIGILRKFIDRSHAADWTTR
jgi:hypothetical protein